MCREVSKESYRVVSWASSPCRTNFYGGECRTFFRRRKKMFRAENLKRYKGKSPDCGTQSGLFLLYPFSSDSSALHITFFSGNSTHPLLRRNSSAGKDAQDPYGRGEHLGNRKKRHRTEAPLWERQCWQGWNPVMNFTKRGKH